MRRLAREVSGGAKSTGIAKEPISSEDAAFATSPRSGTNLINRVVPETSVGGAVTSSDLLGPKDDVQKPVGGKN